MVSVEKMFENVDNIFTYLQTTEAYLYYELTYEPKGSGELKIKKVSFEIHMQVIYTTNTEI